jgi:hypothetical protein
MSHLESLTRRKAMVAYFLEGHTRKETAYKFKVCVPYARSVIYKALKKK